MVGHRILGMLGNHMFQFAFIYSVSEKLETPFFIEYGSAKMNRPRLYTYFKLRNHNYFQNQLLKTWFLLVNRKPRVITLDSEAEPEIELEKLADNCIYTGFAQSEKYFQRIPANDIFKIKKKYVQRFNQKYGELFGKNKIIAIHVRRGDYAEQDNELLGGKDLSLPISYYQNALSDISNIETYQVVIISDDIEYCKINFKSLANCHFVSDTEIIDFQIMKNADVCIIANSSFSWWGAYLNEKVNKMIFAPQYWLGFKVRREFPKGITSVKGWNLIEV
jgi:hypothetical protein